MALLAWVCLPALGQGQTPTSSSPAKKNVAGAAGSATLQKKVEAYIRHLYALGPNVQLTVTTPKEESMWKGEDQTMI